MRYARGSAGLGGALEQPAINSARPRKGRYLTDLFSFESEGGFNPPGGGECDFLLLGTKLLLPCFDRVFAGRNIRDLERSVSAGHREVGMRNRPHVGAHPGVNVT